MQHGEGGLQRQVLGRAGVALAVTLIVLSGSGRAQAWEEAGPPLTIDHASPTVFVQLRTKDPRVRIDRMMDGRAVQTVCWAPCGLSLDAGSQYVISGEGMPSTAPFQLPSDESRITLTVDPGSRAKRTTGLTLLAISFAGTFVGYAFAPHPEDPNDPKARASSPSPAPLLIGLGGLIAGAVGGLLLYQSPTRVYSTTGRSFSGW